MKDFDERLIDCYSSNQAFGILQMIFKSIFKKLPCKVLKAEHIKTDKSI